METFNIYILKELINKAIAITVLYPTEQVALRVTGQGIYDNLGQLICKKTVFWAVRCRLKL